MSNATSYPVARHLDVAVVGAGMSGLYAIHRLRQSGFDVHAFEAGSELGGTWYWNRYPGARCDVESLQYSFSFSPELEQEWHWTEVFAPQDEILAYLRHVADRFDLRRSISFNSRLEELAWDDEGQHWRLRLSTGEELTARFCVMATGNLSSAKPPEVPGLEDFEGEIYHTAEWPAEGVDLSTSRVGLIGTGSSGIQAISKIGRAAAELTVFQRTPNFTLPARNKKITDEYEQDWKSNYPLRREQQRASRLGRVADLSPIKTFDVSQEERIAEYERRWEIGGMSVMYSFSDITTDLRANEELANFVRGKIAATVKDPIKAEILTPRGYPIGAKRICLDTDYYETFNLEHVSIVDISRNHIERITPGGLQLSQGQTYTFDVLVLATGFDAMTGTLLAIETRGRDGIRLRDKWKAGPVNYLGLMTAGFPNFFTVTGPGSPSVLSNMAVSIEQHVDFIADCLAAMRRNGVNTVECTAESEKQWVDTVNSAASQTLYPHAASWYLGANVPGKPRVFMPYAGGVGNYRAICTTVVEQGYKGFVFDKTKSSLRTKLAVG